MDFQNKFLPKFTNEMTFVGCSQHNANLSFRVNEEHNYSKISDDPKIDDNEQYEDEDDDQWIDIDDDSSLNGDVNEKIIDNPQINYSDDDQWIDVDEDDDNKPIHKFTNKLKRKIRKCKKRIKMLRRKIKEKQTKEMTEITDDDVLEFFSNKFNAIQMEFLKMQLQNRIEEPKRTFSTAQKDFALALQMEDPGNYSSLRNIFVLPDIITLEKHSQ